MFTAHDAAIRKKQTQTHKKRKTKKKFTKRIRTADNKEEFKFNTHSEY